MELGNAAFSDALLSRKQQTTAESWPAYAWAVHFRQVTTDKFGPQALVQLSAGNTQTS